MVRLAHFIKNNDEYVVIITDPDYETEDFAEPGYSLENVIELDVDDGILSGYPCNSVLVRS